MYTLYFSPGTASMAVHLALLEIGAPHELRRVDFEKGQQKDPEYLRLNPNGMVPTLVVDGAPHYECAALLLLLAERHPEAKLAPSLGAPERGAYLQWMLHLANTLQPAYRQWFYPSDYAPGDPAPVMRDMNRARIEAVWDRVDAHLAASGTKYFLGDSMTVLDLYALMLMRWSRNMPKPADRWPALARFATHMKTRPSWKKLYEIEGLTEWA